jgi:hypothetical protein
MRLQTATVSFGEFVKTASSSVPSNRTKCIRQIVILTGAGAAADVNERQTLYLEKKFIEIDNTAHRRGGRSSFTPSKMIHHLGLVPSTPRRPRELPTTLLNFLPMIRDSCGLHHLG